MIETPLKVIYEWASYYNPGPAGDRFFPEKVTNVYKLAFFIWLY